MNQTEIDELRRAHGALKVKLDQTHDWYADRWARLRAFLAKGSAMEKGACDIMANGHLLADQDRKSAVALATERAEEAEAERDALKAKLAALVTEVDDIVTNGIDDADDTPGYSSEFAIGCLSRASAAAKE